MNKLKNLFRDKHQWYRKEYQRFTYQTLIAFAIFTISGILVDEFWAASVITPMALYGLSIASCFVVITLHWVDLHERKLASE